MRRNSLFSDYEELLSLPKSVKFDIPPLEPPISLKPQPALQKCRDPVSFRTLQTKPEYLKVKFHIRGECFALRMKKEHLTYENLLEVFTVRFPWFKRAWLIFSDKTLSPIPFDDFMSGIIVDYVLSQDRVQVMLQ